MKLTKILSLGILAVCISACCSCRKNKSSITLPETQWQLITLEGSTLQPKGESYTISFGADNNLSGMGDCNRLMGGYELKNKSAISINMAVATRMMCPDQDMEYRFTQVLESIDSYSIDGDKLMLLSGGDVKMVMTQK